MYIFDRKFRRKDLSVWLNMVVFSCSPAASPLKTDFIYILLLLSEVVRRRGWVWRLLLSTVWRVGSGNSSYEKGNVHVNGLWCKHWRHNKDNSGKKLAQITKFGLNTKSKTNGKKNENIYKSKQIIAWLFHTEHSKSIY